MKTIMLTRAAAKQLDALPRDARDQIEAGLDNYAIHGQGEVKKLQDRMGYRLRVGRYRVIFDEEQTTILAVYIGKRDSRTYSRH